MANIYTWKVTSMQCYPAQPQPDCVFQVSWTCTGTDGVNTTSVNGNTPTPYDQSSPYIPYDQLTQEIALGWVFAGGTVDKTLVENGVAVQLEMMANPPVVTPPLPWAGA